MTASAVITRARSLGIVLEAAGPKLRFDAPNGLPPDLRAALVEHKAEVLALLDTPAEQPDPAGGKGNIITNSSPPYRRPPELAGWPIARRERWGRRSEALELAGVPWPESERRAFAEVAAEPRT